MKDLPIPKATPKQITRNHVPVRTWGARVVICTFGGEPINGKSFCHIYKDDLKVDSCMGYQLDKTLLDYYPLNG